MLNLLKLKNWKQEVPLAYYLQPLEDSITSVRKELLDMTSNGVNRVKYHVEENTDLHTKIIHMVDMDFLAQYLAGDQIKRDQICFLYRVEDIVYNSVLRKKLLENDEEVIKSTIPKLATYRALLVIRDILNRKWDDAQEEKAKFYGTLDFID
jgi:hypothetical protein